MSGAETLNIREIGTVPNGPQAVLKVRIGDFHGRTYCYLAQSWLTPGSDGRTGIRTLAMRPETLEELLPILQEAARLGLRRRMEQGS